MRRWMFGLALLAGAESAAMACACFPPDDSQMAKMIASDAVAVAEVVQIEDMDPQTKRAELYRVTRLIIGHPPRTFRGVREFEGEPPGVVTVQITDCDAAPGPNESRIVTLYKPRLRYDGSGTDIRVTRPKLDGTGRSFDFGSMCDYLFLQKPGALDLIRAEAVKLGKRVY